MRQPKRRVERYQRRYYSPRQAFGSANYLTSVVGGGTTTPETNPYFQILIKTNNAGISNSTSIALPVSGTFDIDWGDGNSQTITSAVYTTPTTHDYGVAGQYVIRISEGLTRVYFANAGDRLKLLKIQNFGDIVLSTLSQAFRGCNNLQVTATDSAVFFANNQALAAWDYAFREALIVSDPWSDFPDGGAGIVLRGSCTLAFANNANFNGNFALADISEMSLATSIFATSGMSAENYSKTLIGWANQVSAGAGPYNINMSTQTGRTYNSTNYGGTPFNNAVDARAYLVLATGSGGAGWTITGDAAV